MPRNRILSDEERKEHIKASKRKWFNNKYQNDNKFREKQLKRMKESRSSVKQEDMNKIKKISSHIKITSRGYPNQYKDFYTIEELEIEE